MQIGNDKAAHDRLIQIAQGLSDPVLSDPVADAFRQFGFEQNLCRTATAVRDTSPQQDEPGPVFTSRGATTCGGHDWRGVSFVRRRCLLLAAGGRVMRGSLGEKIGEGAFSDVHAWVPGSGREAVQASRGGSAGTRRE
jgi:hypothetical protein